MIVKNLLVEIIYFFTISIVILIIHQFEIDFFANNDLKNLLAKGVGGVILVGGSTTELYYRCSTLQSWASSPLLLCADIEEGLGQRFEGGTRFVPPLSFNQIYKKDHDEAINLAELYGKCIGNQAKKVGLNWVLAPVCDVNNNPKNPVINVRAWSDKPLVVASLASSFKLGM